MTPAVAYTTASQSCAFAHKFTGKERDSETGLDYFGARYYGSALGRFTSPDPGNTGSDPRDPQSWNAYAYTGNNPLSRVDASGLDYSVCTNDGNGGQQCSYIASDQAAEEALRNPGAGLSASNGNIYSTDENGNQVQIGTYQHFLGPGDSQGMQVDYGFDLAALGLLRGGVSALEGAAAGTVARSALWSLASTVRGGVVEEMLGANLPRTFPVIDSFADGVATSIKSVDLSAASYQAPDALASRLSGLWPNPVPNNTQYTCTYQYDTPAVQKKFVSFDGVNEILEEDYTYSTTWNGGAWTAKATTVATKVSAVQAKSLQSLGTFQTVYNYTPIQVGQNPYDIQNSVGYSAGQLPLEQSTIYGDTSGKTLKTVAKTWLNQDLVHTIITTAGTGPTKESIYTYSNSNQLASEMDYDYGTQSHGPLLKEVVINYPSTPFNSHRPCQVIIYDGSGTKRVAETDYFYDGGTSLCGAPGGLATQAVSGVVGHDEMNYSASSAAFRGNVTQMIKQLLPSASISESYSYDETGQTISRRDGNGNTTVYSYLDSYVSGSGTPSGQTNTYLTSVTLPSTVVAHNEKCSYRYSDGQLASAADQNSQITSYAYNDTLNRLTQTNNPDGGQTTNSYNDSGTTPSVTTTTLLTSSSSITTKVTADGAGHPITTLVTSDPSGAVESDSVYDGLGRLRSVSNPYRSTSEPTYGLTTYQYDGLGRTVAVTPPDGATVLTTYSGANTTITDAAGKARILTNDGLERLASVTEDPGSSPHLNYATTYTYDALDDLYTVEQGSQKRTFNYDSLRRLTSATNPENGIVSYDYDNAGNLHSKTDFRNTVITYSYDALNRLNGKFYSDGTPTCGYSYDAGTNGMGHLTWMSDGYTQSSYTSFDAVGRVTASQQTIYGQNYPFTYSYNLAGALLSESYPSGRKISLAYDGAGHATTVSGALHGVSKSYVSGATYAPQGVPNLYYYGNNLARRYTFNNRLQVSVLSDAVGNNDSLQLFNLGYTWQPTASKTAANNGNVQSIVENIGGYGYSTFFTLNESYTYDGANRLSSATGTYLSPNPLWKQSFSYDAYGNQWVTGNTFSGSTPTANVYDSGTNQIIGGSYDAAGNQLLVNGDRLAYDAENRIISVTEPPATGGGTESIGYDAQGRRVFQALPTGSLISVYDAFGQLAAEYSFLPPTESSCQTCYLSGDLLGSTRLVTDAATNVVARHDYLSFGQEIPAGLFGRDNSYGRGDGVKPRFTGQLRDQETGLDYFGARYYGSALGRFTSPDEFKGGIVDLFTGQDIETNTALPYADITNPQSLNKYSYVLNNPLRYTDPTGHCPECLVWGAELLDSPAGQEATEWISGNLGKIAVGASAIAASAVFAGAGREPGGYVPGGLTDANGNSVFASKTNQQNQGASDQKAGPAYEPTQENVDRMKEGKAPIGNDGKSVELHHQDQNPQGPVKEMTRTDHRGEGNYSENHPQGNRQPTRIDRNEAARQRRQYWKDKARQQENQ